MPVSRRKIKRVPEKKSITASNGVVLEKCYCRKCCLMKPPGDFFISVDMYLDTSGKMSVCKKCVNEMFGKFYSSERTIQKALYRLCKILNVRYDEEAVAGAEEYVRKCVDSNKEYNNVFGIYKNRLSAANSKNLADHDILEDFTFYEVDVPIVSNTMPDDEEDAVDLKQFWGSNFEYDDYVFLERELTEWKKTHKSDTKAEITLLKELCHKSFEIRKAREVGKPTAALVKEYQELMKTANVDPAKTAMIGAGKAQDTFSGFIKMIEENEPADFYKDKALFNDIDNIYLYFKNFVLRPIRNFMTQSRIFNLSDGTEDEEEFDDLPLSSYADESKAE